MHKLSLLIISLLVLATLITKVQIFTYNTDEFKLNLKRIKTWWIICLLGISIFYVNGWAITLLCISLTIWALLELSRIFYVNLTVSHNLLIAATLLIYTLQGNQLQEYQTALFILPIVLLIFSLFFKHKLHIQFIAMLLFCISAIYSIDSIAHFQIDNIDSRFLVLFLCFITGVNDIAQYVFGKVYGNKIFSESKLAPSISPKKTIEGALGGIIVTGLATSLILSNTFPINYLFALIIGVVISVLGIMGDLCFSYYKRQAKVKHFGSSLPGHGGLLDRIDSLLLTAPGFGICLIFIN